MTAENDPGTAAPGRVTPGPYRYARWDGRQRLEDITADDLLDEMSDDILAESDLSSALARLLARGMRGDSAGEQRFAGFNELLRRMADAREELLSKYELRDVLADVREQLDDIVNSERRALERHIAGVARDETTEPQLRQLASDLAARRQEQLEQLPSDVGGQIRALTDYDFMDQNARARFEELLDQLRRQVLDAQFAGMSEALKGMTSDDLATNRDMVRELNGLLQERLNGNEVDASDFLSRYGSVFPGAETLDDIIEQLEARMAQMQSLMQSLSAEQRQELQDMMDALLRDDRLRWDLAQLAATLDALLPQGLGQRYDFQGGEQLTLEGALAQLGRLNRMDELASQMGSIAMPEELADIDPDEIAELLDAESAADIRKLQEMAKLLEQAGYAERNGK